MEGLGAIATDTGHDVRAQSEYTEAKPALGIQGSEVGAPKTGTEETHMETRAGPCLESCELPGGQK